MRNGLRYYSEGQLPRSLDGGRSRNRDSTSPYDASKPEQEYIPVKHYPDKRFQVPPPRTTAPISDEVDDAEYERAMTGDGLPNVGGLTGWWEDEERWPKSQNFRGFSKKPRSDYSSNKRHIEAVVRRALVETLALRQAGRAADLVRRWSLGPEEAAEAAAAVKFKGERLIGNIEDVVKNLFTEKGAGSSMVHAKAQGEQVRSNVYPQDAPSWECISFADPRMKFAVMKRVFQLTGVLIPDHELSEIMSPKHLLELLLRKPAPKTLTKALLTEKKDLGRLPNVFISAKRWTRGDKDRALGRYKMIEEEFKKRNITIEEVRKVTIKEKQWLLGNA